MLERGRCRSAAGGACVRPALVRAPRRPYKDGIAGVFSRPSQQAFGSPMDRKALIGLLSGVTAVIATMIGVALVNTREAEGASTVARPLPHDCSLGSRAAEPGYGPLPPNEICARSY